MVAGTDRRSQFKRTKIVATLGPASSDQPVIERLIRAGVDAVRINASHSDAAHIEALITVARRAAARLEKPLGVILDLQGPKVRVMEMQGGMATLKHGQEFRLTARKKAGDAAGVGLNHPSVLRDLTAGDMVLLDDGAIRLKVTKAGASQALTRVEVGGVLRSHKGVNLPDIEVSLPSLTEKDKEDVRLAVRLGVDWLALSFLRSPGDVRALKNLLAAQRSDIPVIAKIEKREALGKIDAVLAAADALMVARGDLGIEMPIEDVPVIQKDLIARAVVAGKPVITATQMLESMIGNPTPTRAEATDVANAILDQTDAVMLSGETAVGRYPVEAVQVMTRIITRTESVIPYAYRLEEKSLAVRTSTTEAIGFAACDLASVLKAAVIVAPTETGFTARQIAKFRPQAPIVAASPNPHVVNRLCIVWGVVPRKLGTHRTLDELFRLAAEEARLSGLARAGQSIVITAGVKLAHDTPTTNTIKVSML